MKAKNSKLFICLKASGEEIFNFKYYRSKYVAGFSSKEFVDNLLTKGSYLSFDETSDSFNQEELHPYYNEEMYKRLWKSIKNNKSQHNSASKQASNILGYRISEKYMALTQFGFMGLVLTKNIFLGIYDINDEDLKCFIHVWGVIGYVLGIQDEFNICREAVDGTMNYVT